MALKSIVLLAAAATAQQSDTEIRLKEFEDFWRTNKKDSQAIQAVSSQSVQKAAARDEDFTYLILGGVLLASIILVFGLVVACICYIFNRRKQNLRMPEAFDTSMLVNSESHVDPEVNDKQKLLSNVNSNSEIKVATARTGLDTSIQPSHYSSVAALRGNAAEAPDRTLIASSTLI